MARSSFHKGEGNNRVFQGPDGNLDVVREALERLSRYAHFCAHTNSISIDFREGTLVVTGILPSFYLKQVLQTILRDLPGVVRIDNRVEVVAAGNALRPHFSPSRNSDHEQHD
jgi:hypothetical protein